MSGPPPPPPPSPSAERRGAEQSQPPNARCQPPPTPAQRRSTPLDAAQRRSTPLNAFPRRSTAPWCARSLRDAVALADADASALARHRRALRRGPPGGASPSAGHQLLPVQLQGGRRVRGAGAAAVQRHGAVPAALQGRPRRGARLLQAQPHKGAGSQQGRGRDADSAVVRVGEAQERVLQVRRRRPPRARVPVLLRRLQRRLRPRPRPRPRLAARPSPRPGPGAEAVGGVRSAA